LREHEYCSVGYATTPIAHKHWLDWKGSFTKYNAKQFLFMLWKMPPICS
jgi:hypothetical protein